MKPISRREALRRVAGAVGLAAASPVLAATGAISRAPIGIGMHSYGFQWRAGKQNREGAKFHDALTFLQYADQLGAAGVQVTIGDNDRAYAQGIKAEAEKNGLYFEAQFQLPKDDADLDRFERDVRLARDAGATTIVVGLPLSLSGAIGPAAKATLAEIDELRAVAEPAGMSVVAYDERLTTITAERALNEARMRREARRRIVDKIAAAVMLQSWLDGDHS